MNSNISISTGKAANSLLAFLLFLLCTCMAGRAMAQSPSPMFYKEVLLNHKPYTLHSLTREMQRQSGITFSYNAARIRPNQKIKVRDGKMTVERLLALLKKRSGIAYKIVSSNHIVYVEGPKEKKKGLFARKKEPKKPQPRKVVPATLPATAASAPQLAKAPAIDSSLLPPGGRLVIVGDSSVAMGYYFSGGSNSGGAYAGSGAPKVPGEEWKDPYLDLNATADTKGENDSKTVRFLKNHLLVAGGVSVDEINYFNPGLRVGFDFLYGTLSYDMGGATQVRYGLGTSLKLDDKWNLHLNVNTGKSLSGNGSLFTRDTIPPAFPDSIDNPTYINKTYAIVTTSRLSRISLILEYQLTRGLTVSAGATLNYLTTKYSSEGLPVSFNTYAHKTIDDPDKEFRVFKPPYLLSNSYSGENPDNTKLWIGFQLSLYYRIPFTR